MKATVRLTRRELIYLESVLRSFTGAGGDEALYAMAEAFNREVAGTDIRPIRPMIALEADRLADRLGEIEETSDFL